MKVKYRHSKMGEFEISTSELIVEGVIDRYGQLEMLEETLDRLIRVVAVLIDRSGITGKELLKITNCEYKYEIVDHNQGQAL